MDYKKPAVRRYVMRTRLFALPNPQRNARAVNALGSCGEKLPQPAPAAQRTPKE